jgi:ArsR family transcriptional regulator, arsenate/arsenite/antimonite-responsive transcriptional repressor
MDDLAPTLKAIADPVRLQILGFLLAPDASCCSRGDGVCGCDFESLLGLSQPTVSHHMRLLVESGLVRAEKRGRWVYYELEGSSFARVIDALRPFAAAAPVASGRR